MYGKIRLMKKTTLRIDQEIFDAIQAKCQRFGDFQWLVNGALRKEFCKPERETYVKRSKPQIWKDFYRAYPENRRGGTDATAWKAAQSERLNEDDFETMYQDILKRGKLSYCPGITKYIREKRWLTPLPYEEVDNGSSRKLSLSERSAISTAKALKNIDAAQDLLGSDDSPLWPQVGIERR